MSVIKELRDKLERAKREAAVSEAQIEALDESYDEYMAELREILECEKGEEKKALKELDSFIKSKKEEFDGAIEDVEKVISDEH